MTFSKTFIQRTIYLFTFVTYIILWAVNKNYQLLSQKSSIGFSYWIIDLLVVIPLLFQYFFNTKIGWVIITVLLCIHFVLALFRIRNNYDGSFITIIPICIFYIIPFAILYYLYPRKSSINNKTN